MKPEISILVLCYQYTKYTEQTINSVLDTATSNYNLIIQPTMIDSAKNSNCLIDSSPTEYMILVDDDVMFRNKGWDECLIGALTLSLGVGVVVPRLFSANHDPINEQSHVPKDTIMSGIKSAGAVMAFREQGLRHDEAYKKTQYNDTDFLYQHLALNQLVIVDGRVDVLHMRKPNFSTPWNTANRAYFLKKWKMNDYDGWGPKRTLG